MRLRVPAHKQQQQKPQSRSSPTLERRRSHTLAREQQCGRAEAADRELTEAQETAAEKPRVGTRKQAHVSPGENPVLQSSSGENPQRQQRARSAQLRQQPLRVPTQLGRRATARSPGRPPAPATAQERRMCSNARASCVTPRRQPATKSQALSSAAVTTRSSRDARKTRCAMAAMQCVSERTANTCSSMRGR